MARYRVILLLVGFRLFGAGQSSTEALFRAIQTADSAAVRRLLSAGVNANAKDADVIFAKRACITCHSQTLPAQVAAAARRKGIAIDESMARKNLEQIVTWSRPLAEAALQGDQPAGQVLTLGYVMSALGSEHHPLDKTTAAFTHLIAATQMSDGRWIGLGNSRPPLEDSVVSQTVLAVHGMTLYPVPG
jgi:hypothetical protein